MQPTSAEFPSASALLQYTLDKLPSVLTELPTVLAALPSALADGPKI